MTKEDTILNRSLYRIRAIVNKELQSKDMEKRDEDNVILPFNDLKIQILDK